MSLTPDSNIYLSTANELQALSSLTEEARLYREAAIDVLARPKNRDAGPHEKDLIMSKRTLDDLLETVNETREKNKLFDQKDPSVLSRSARAIVDTLNRFEKAITNLAQASTRLLFPDIRRLIESNLRGRDHHAYLGSSSIPCYRKSPFRLSKSSF